MSFRNYFGFGQQQNQDPFNGQASNQQQLNYEEMHSLAQQHYAAMMQQQIQVQLYRSPITGKSIQVPSYVQIPHPKVEVGEIFMTNYEETKKLIDSGILPTRMINNVSDLEGLKLKYTGRWQYDYTISDYLLCLDEPTRYGDLSYIPSKMLIQIPKSFDECLEVMKGFLKGVA